MLLKSLVLTSILGAIGTQAVPLNTTTVVHGNNLNVILKHPTRSQHSKASDMDSNKMLRAIKKMDDHLIAFNQSVTDFKYKRFPFMLPQIIRLQKRSNSMRESVKDATEVAQDIAQLDEVESGRVASKAVELSGHATSVLANLVVHKPLFDTAIAKTGSISKSVAADLEKQANATAVFSSNLMFKLSPAYQTLAPDLVHAMELQYKKVIDLFRADSGNHDMPVVNGLLSFAHAKLKTGWKKFTSGVKATFSHKYRQKKWDEAVHAEAEKLVAGSHARNATTQQQAMAFLIGSEMVVNKVEPVRVPVKVPVFVGEGTPVVVVDEKPVTVVAKGGVTTNFNGTTNTLVIKKEH